ncbi:4-phosphopantetheinyl transferase [Duganella sp. sic0402]|uniref:4'-phosphopantetheinyl transferase family protein n=1 Tax=Duganella sp. sic0402 TaxID=2854786 RepID=UPI001C487E2F|nr:4-phosphopantetheinyl transferase [Duganella sp. sic0402]MBV7537682.1 4-phosphopantetheinyl transferase [Duganella sp. sic0402]
MKTLAVHRWPGPTPAPKDGLFAILISTAGRQREEARRLLRWAAREALAAVLGVPVNDIDIASAPGTPPCIVLAGRPAGIGLSFTHDDNYSLAAMNLHGPIGADIMRVQDVPDWQAVARDYLGPAIAASLLSAASPLAFIQAWTQREAALKCHAQQLSEWQADLPGQSISLLLPADGLVGNIHIGDKNA